MSLLPQHKKSPEEIAKLRESLGIQATSPDGPPAHQPPQTASSPPDKSLLDPKIGPQILALDSPLEPAQPAVPHGPKPVHSLKRSERARPASETAAQPAVTPLPDSTVSTSSAFKTVTSLRKSEQVPILIPPAPLIQDGSKLPVHRHNDQEIQEIRRREAIAMMTPPPNPKLAAAHPVLLTIGYLLAAVGATCFFYQEFPIIATAVCPTLAIFLSLFIFLRRPISRHHAAFTMVIALFVLIFAILHYFPFLQHAA